MKIKLFAVVCALCVSFIASASAVDWSIQFGSDSQMATEWGNAHVYSYLTLASSSANAMSPEEFMSQWTTDMTSTATEIVGNDFNYSERNTGAVAGWTEGGRVDGPWAGYLIVVIVKENGEAMYAYYGDAEGTTLVAREDNAAGTTIYDFTEDSNWIAVNNEPVNPDVPEPTALALLALGVAGVALRRRVV